VLLYELTHGFTPFKNIKTLDVLKLRIEELQRKGVTRNATCSPDLYDLIEKLLVEDPEKRYDISGIFHHKWTQPYLKKFGINISDYLGTKQNPPT
jgi:serine/threonine protein kinase